MKINFTTTINDLDNAPIPHEKGELTLKTVATMSLLATTEEVNKLPGTQKVHRALLAQTIHGSNSNGVDIVVEDIAMLKEAISKAYAPIVIMRAWEILDPKA